MRRGMILMAGLLMASTAMPQAAQARPFFLKMLHGITSPLGALTGGGRHASRRAHHSHRRATASRRAPAIAAAETHRDGSWNGSSFGQPNHRLPLHTYRPWPQFTQGR